MNCSGNLLAFIHAGTSFRIDEFTTLTDELGAHLNMPEEASMLGTVFVHEHWPPDRRVLGVTG